MSHLDAQDGDPRRRERDLEDTAHVISRPSCGGGASCESCPFQTSSDLTLAAGAPLSNGTTPTESAVSPLSPEDALLAAYPPFLSLTGGNAAYAGSVRRICLTGGPCAGKSTCLARIREAVEAHTPYKVFCVPEAATLLVGGGLNWGDAKDDAAVLQYQLALLRTQLALEDAFLRLAATCGHPAIVIADRGTMDGRCYMADHLWDKMVRAAGFTTEALRDERYDVVIHLVSAAIGASAFYNLDNPARFEDVAAAVDADNRARRMYLGHPCVRTVDNSGASFADKVQRTVDIVFETIGERPPGPIARHFALRIDPTLFASRPGHTTVLPVTAVSARITRTFLAGSTDTCVRSVQLRQHLAAGCNFAACAELSPDGVPECMAAKCQPVVPPTAPLLPQSPAPSTGAAAHNAAAHVGTRWPSFFALPAKAPQSSQPEVTTPTGMLDCNACSAAQDGTSDATATTPSSTPTTTPTARPVGAVTAVIGAAAAAAAAVAASQSSASSVASAKSPRRRGAPIATSNSNTAAASCGSILAPSCRAASVQSASLCGSIDPVATTVATPNTTVHADPVVASGESACAGCPSRVATTTGAPDCRSEKVPGLLHGADASPPHHRASSSSTPTSTATLRAVTYSDGELTRRTGRYEAMILMPQYTHLAADASPRHDVLRLCQHSFIHDGRYCQLKVYISPRRLYGLATLSVEDTVASLEAAEAKAKNGEAAPAPGSRPTTVSAASSSIVPAFLGEAIETTGAAVMEPARLAEVAPGRTLDVEAVFTAVAMTKAACVSTF